MQILVTVAIRKLPTNPPPPKSKYWIKVCGEIKRLELKSSHLFAHT